MIFPSRRFFLSIVSQSNWDHCDFLIPFLSKSVTKRFFANKSIYNKMPFAEDDRRCCHQHIDKRVFIAAVGLSSRRVNKCQTQSPTRSLCSRLFSTRTSTKPFRCRLSSLTQTGPSRSTIRLQSTGAVSASAARTSTDTRKNFAAAIRSVQHASSSTPRTISL